MKINRVTNLHIKKTVIRYKFTCFHSPISCVLIRKLIAAKKTRDLNANIGTRSKPKEDLF